MSRKILSIDENLELRLPEEDFAEGLFHTINAQREYLQQWLPWVATTNEVSDSRNFLKMARLYNSGGQKLITFIFSKSDEEPAFLESKRLVGSVGLVRIDKINKSAELGFWLSYAFQGRGIVTNSILRLLTYVFDQMDVHRIEVNVAEKNKKSIAVIERLGFKKEGIGRDALFFENKFHSLVRYSLLKNEWKA